MFFKKHLIAAPPPPEAEPDADRTAYSSLPGLEEETRRMTLEAALPDIAPTIAAAHRRRAAARVLSAGKPELRPDLRLSDDIVLRDLAECDREIGQRRVAIEEGEQDVALAERELEKLGAPAEWWRWTRLSLAAGFVAALGTTALALLLVESVDLIVLRAYWLDALHDPRVAFEASRPWAWWLSFAVAGCFVGAPPLAALLAGGLSTRAKAVILALELAFAGAFAALRADGAVTGRLLAWTGFELAVAGTALILAFHVSHAIVLATQASQAARAARQAAEGARRRLGEDVARLEAALARREIVRRPVAVRDWDVDARARIARNAEESVALVYEVTTREISERVPNPFDPSRGASTPAH